MRNSAYRLDGIVCAFAFALCTSFVTHSLFASSEMPSMSIDKGRESLPILVAQRPRPYTKPPMLPLEAIRPIPQLSPTLERMIDTLVGDGREQSNSLSRSEADKQACTFGSFVERLIRSDMFLWEKEHKDELGIMPYHQATRKEEQARFHFKKAHAARFFSGLGNLNAAGRTLVLVYGEREIELVGDDKTRRTYMCVWLADQTGLLVSDSTFDEKGPRQYTEVDGRFQWIDDNFLVGLWPDLLVDARSAGRSARKLKSGEACKKQQPVPVTDEEFGAMRAALKRIGDRLIPPSVAEALMAEPGDDARLYVVPVGTVQRIPFAALPLGNGHLVDKFAIIVAPASSVIGDLSGAAYRAPSVTTSSSKNDANAPEALIVGDPDLKWDRNNYCWPKLPFARKEAEFAGEGRTARKVLTGSQATFDAVSAQLKAGQKSLRYIHFATHGMSDDIDPADKGFLALNKGHLSGASLRKMKLWFGNNPIVVMSACYSGTGKTFAGGVFGLADFWWFSGAPQVVVSLWSVDDEGTNKLMKYFSDALAESANTPSGRNGAEFALTKATRRLKAEEQDPTIWSSFTVIGKPMQ